MEALLEIYNLQVGFAIFSNPGVAKPFGGNLRIILFGVTTWFYL